MKKFLILVRALPQYRIDFYNRLREELREKNISLSLIYGKSKSKRALKKDEKELKWAEYLPNKIFNFGVI